MAGPKKSLCTMKDAGTPTDVLRDHPSSTQGAPILRFASSRKTSAPRIRPGPNIETLFIWNRKTIGRYLTNNTRIEALQNLWTDENRSSGERMKAGTNRRIREKTLRQGISDSLNRDLRQRYLPTKHGHAWLCSITNRVIREYQSDSSSKRPPSSFLLGSCCLELKYSVVRQ